MNTREQTPRPRTKAKRRLAAAGGFAIVLFLIFVLVAYTGDPVSKHLAMNTAETYANETYPGYDIKAVAASARHWFRYEVVLESAVSEDTHFLVEVKQGRVIEDSYDETVKNGRNTWDRIIVSLGEDVDAALAEAGISHAGFGLYQGYYLGSSGEVPVPAEGHPSLTVDMPYDKGDLPPVALALDLNAPDGVDDPQAAARQLAQQVKDAMDEAGIDLAAYVVTLYGMNNRVVVTTGLIPAADLA